MTIRTVLCSLLVFAPLACAPKADTATPEPTPAPAPVVKKPVQPIPDGFRAITPQLTVKGVDAAVDFYIKAFAAKKLFTMPGPDGKTMHAELMIGDSIVFLDEEMNGNKSPLTLGGTPVVLHLFVPDADAVFATAPAAGARADKPVAEGFWGDRYGEVTAPDGHRWAIAQHVEDVTDAQIKERAAIMFAAASKKGKKAKVAKDAAPAWKKIAGTPSTQAVPAGYHTVTLSVVVSKAAEAIDFYKSAHGAREVDRMLAPDGKVLHATLDFGDSRLMLGDEMLEMGLKSATTLGGSPVAIHYYVTDADAAFTKVTGAGAKVVMPLTDMFWGDRYGAATDPAGLTWGFATHKEDVTPEQMAERMKADSAAQAKPTT